ncbi:hypothetical protein OMAG_001317 [Candidatus Omnitrophus magneticus]|uniref:Uncharacterized protein n=1 Tax=Candidatus Omnitrophus magneticus TaxID=1609969 RepID=A0A0F0CTF9_9BACT|nr:hypothetical protein OMAG_001317 [Candidatus Omnitrophus magneticus]
MLCQFGFEFVVVYVIVNKHLFLRGFPWMTSAKYNSGQFIFQYISDVAYQPES